MSLTKSEVKMTLWKTKFTFAKSMPSIPHEWSHRKDWWSDQSFENVVKYIRENGVTEKFYKKEFTYLYANGYKYWTMGNPIKTTIIINRAKISEDKNDL